MMDLSQLANLGEFIGGIAVLATLVYVAVQVRHARSQLKEQSVSSAMVTIMASFDPVYLEATAPVFRRGLHGEELTDPDDRYVFDLLMHRQAAGLLMGTRTGEEMGEEMVAGLRGLVWGYPGAKIWLAELPASVFKNSINAALALGVEPEA